MTQELINRALVVAGDAGVHDCLTEVLESRGLAALSTLTVSGALDELERHRDEIVLIIQDLSLVSGQISESEALRQWRREAMDVPMILLAEPGTELAPTMALELGASDAVVKGDDLGRLMDASLDKVGKFLNVVGENLSLRRETTRLKLQTLFYHENFKAKYRIVGSSRALTRVLDEAKCIASVPRPVLIRGERGTGKELLAAFIHYKSNRRNNPFITVNSAGFHGDLLASEMFGHERGAFTGAHERKIGRFELADTGTLFFDEVGDMVLDFQEQILRAIEYQEFERVQGMETIKVDVRVIAATNADLDELMDKGAFRRDLYDRLSFQVLTMPPLRGRVDDIPVLVDYFSDEIVRDVPGLERRPFSPEAMAVLQKYAWPGNVRELKYLVERLMCRATALPVSGREVQGNIMQQPQPASSVGSFEERVEQFRKSLIQEALNQCQHKQKDAAEYLGLTYDQFRYSYCKFFK